MYRAAGFGDVPWGAWLGVLLVGHVGCDLGVRGDGPEGAEDGVRDAAE